MFTADDLISVYTRAQAIEDGALYLVPAKVCALEGLRLETVFTVGLLLELRPTPEEAHEGLSLEDRVRNVLRDFVTAIRCARDANTVTFLAQLTGGKAVEVVGSIGPDDSGAPCFTLMLPGED